MLDDACQVILNVSERLPSAAVNMSFDTPHRKWLSAGGAGGGGWDVRGEEGCRGLVHDEVPGGRRGRRRVLLGRSVHAMGDSLEALLMFAAKGGQRSTLGGCAQSGAGKS